MTKLNFAILSSGGRWRERQRAIRYRRRETVRSPSGLKSLFHPVGPLSTGGRPDEREDSSAISGPPLARWIKQRESGSIVSSAAPAE